MPTHRFSSLSLDELKALAARTNDPADLGEILEYVRDSRRTRGARLFQGDLEKRLDLIASGRPTGDTPAIPRSPPLRDDQPELALERAGPPRRRRAPPKPKFAPTDEQVRALDAFMRGGSLKVCAFAGAGKTSTLKLMANEREGLGLYLAFNRKIARDARGDFPAQVDCRTTHSLAARSVKSKHGYSDDKMFKRIGAMQLASTLELKTRRIDGALSLTPQQQAFLFLATVQRFRQQADVAMSLNHVYTTPRLLGLRPAALEDVQRWVLDNASQLWTRMIDAADPIPLDYDGYLKVWAMGAPKLHHEYILLDEAQDTNPVVLDVMTAQESQMVYVGDQHQQIYEWRGAVNAMDKIDTAETETLTQSFRFGPEIAQAANKVLRSLGERLPLRGNQNVVSSITAIGEPDAILARTNATVIAETLAAIDRGRRPYIVGGTTELRRLVGDVFNLKKGEPGSHPDFFGFKNWDEIVAYADSDEGESLRPIVNLVETNGPGRLWAAITNSASEPDQADLSISTAHKAKGAEWDVVQLANDFLAEGQAPNEICKAEARLFYVAMTRAKRQLIVQPALLDAYTSAGSFAAADVFRRTKSRRSSQPGFDQTPRGQSAPQRSQETLDPAGGWPEGMF
jgi:hypothetical protein